MKIKNIYKAWKMKKVFAKMALHKIKYMGLYVGALSLILFYTPILHAHIYDSLEFQTITQFSGIQATVSSQPSDSADFSTLKLAIDDGHKAIRIVGNTVETAAATLLPDCDYLIVIDANVSLDFVNFNLLYAATGTGSFEQTLFLRGMGQIDYTFTTIDNRLFKRNGRAVILDVEDLTIQNDSTANSSSVTDADVVRIRNVIFNVANTFRGGLSTSDETRNNVNGVVFKGGGAASTEPLTIDKSGDYSNIDFVGTYMNFGNLIGITGLPADDALVNFNNINISEVVTSGNGGILMHWCGQINNFIALRGAAPTTIVVVTDNTTITNVISDTMTIDLAANSSCKLTNVIIPFSSTIAFIDLSDAGANNTSIVNSTFKGFRGDIVSNGNKFSNCDIEAVGDTSDITIAGDQNQFSNSRIGSATSGGTDGIIITATADKTLISNCLTDVAISDSGTNSSFANNVIY